MHTTPSIAIPPARFSKAKEWTKLIAITGMAQVVVQAIGFACGILVIRLLSIEEYALYTLANMMLGTMTVLADSGVSTGVMSQGGKVWQDKAKLGAVLATGMSLRRKFAVYSLAFAVPVLFYLLHRHGASLLMSTMLVLSLIPAFFTALSGTLLEIAPKLYQDIAPLQKIQVSTSIIRLALTGLTLFVFPFAGLAILSSGIAQIFANWRLRSIMADYSDGSQPIDACVRSEMIRIVKRVFPGVLYFVLSGQVAIWLMALLGSTESVAQLGAIGRLAMIVSLLGLLFNILIVPRFARCPNDKSRLLKIFLAIEVMASAFVGIVVVCAWVFQSILLALLGTKYSGLGTELTIFALATSTGICAQSNMALCNSRAYVPAWYFVPLGGVITTALAIALFCDGTLMGVLRMNTFVALLSLVSSFGIFIYYNNEKFGQA